MLNQIYSWVFLKAKFQFNIMMGIVYIVTVKKILAECHISVFLLLYFAQLRAKTSTDLGIS